MSKPTGYMGNPNLKKINEPIEWSAELAEEYIKCSQDPVYFTEKYMRIINVNHGLIPFNLYPYQKTMVNMFHDNRFNIVTTARQAGKSATVCAYILWYVLFQPEVTVGLLANKGDTAREILGR